MVEEKLEIYEDGSVAYPSGGEFPKVQRRTFDDWWSAMNYEHSRKLVSAAGMAWGEATRQERKRCIEAVNKALDTLGSFEDVETDIGSWDVRRHCINAIKYPI